MFGLIKLIIKIAFILFVAYFILRYFGYDINWKYYNETKDECQKRLEDCGKNLVKKGTEGALCNFDCVDPKLIIKKK